jgi:Cdc6-like AAA superfamily ATPase
MNRSPFLFRDFVRARKYLIEALVEGDETYAMLTGETGTGKTALLRICAAKSIAAELASSTSRARRSSAPPASSR